MNFRLHFMNDQGNGLQTDYRGPTCPFVSVPANICNLFGVMTGQAMTCYGLNPPRVCPLMTLGDVAITAEQEPTIQIPS
jgi:hypothetical protein